MKRRLIIILALCVGLCSSVGAAIYDWTGAAGDGDWANPDNWSVTGSTYIHPNEEFGNEYTNQDCDEINLINGDTVFVSGGLSPDGSRDHSNICVLTIDNGSVLDVSGTIWIADYGNTQGMISVLNGSTLKVGGQLKAGDDPGSVGTLNISNSSVTIGSNLIITNRAGGTGYLNISGNSTLDVGGRFYMNDQPGADSMSYVVMDGGTVTTSGNCYFNDDAGLDSMATVTMNGGTWNSGGTIDISWNLDATSQLIMNGGEMTASTSIRLGVGGGGNAGQSRIFMNGGVLQGEGLEFNMADSQIIFADGWSDLKINGSLVTETQALIDDGTIDVSGLIDYTITEEDGYTVLATVPGVPGMPIPTNKAMSVGIDETLSWQAPIAITATGYNVYMGDPNESGPDWFGNNLVVDNENVLLYTPEVPLEYETTYYWRVDALEPNSTGEGVIVHESMVWSFTTGPDTPVVTLDPVNFTVDFGETTATFIAEGSNTDSYEWYKSLDAANDTEDDDDPVVGEVAAPGTLELAGVTQDDEGYYYCKLINSHGSVKTGTAILMTKRPVSQWKFEQSLLDSKGGNNGEPFGGDPEYGEGISGDGLKLYADGKAVAVPNTYELNTESFTIAAWANVAESTGDFQALVSNRSTSPDSGYILYASSANKWEFWTGPGWDNLGSGDSATDVVIGEWVHVTGTFDVTQIEENGTIIGTKKLYINGEMMAQTDEVEYIVNSKLELLIGAGANEDAGYNYFFNGQIDDVRYFSYALDPTEIAGVYFDGSGKSACTNRPTYDMNNDCVIDLKDVAKVASGWMECGLWPTTYCP